MRCRLALAVLSLLAAQAAGRLRPSVETSAVLVEPRGATEPAAPGGGDAAGPPKGGAEAAEAAEARLLGAAHNLTEQMHAQAVIVGQATQRLYSNEEALNRTSVEEAELSARYVEAHVAATNASRELQVYLADLAAAKARRDGLRNLTDDLQVRLARAGAEYKAAEDDYQHRLEAMPWLQGAADRTNATDADAGVKRQRAVEAAKAARSAVEFHASELERSIKELNGLNTYLRSVEDELHGGRGPGRSRARPAARGPLPLAVAGLVALLAASTPGLC